MPERHREQAIDELPRGIVKVEMMRKEAGRLRGVDTPLAARREVPGEIGRSLGFAHERSIGAPRDRIDVRIALN